MRCNMRVHWRTGGVATLLLWVTRGHIGILTPAWNAAVCLLPSGFMCVISQEEYKHVEGKDQTVYFFVFSPVTGTQQGLNECMASCCSTHLSLSNNDPTTPWPPCTRLVHGDAKGPSQFLSQLPDSLPGMLPPSAGFLNYTLSFVTVTPYQAPGTVTHFIRVSPTSLHRPGR